MKQRSEATQTLLFDHATIQKWKNEWYVFLDDGTKVGPFSSEARAENWKRQYESTRTPK